MNSCVKFCGMNVEEIYENIKVYSLKLFIKFLKFILIYITIKFAPRSIHSALFHMHQANKPVEIIYIKNTHTCHECASLCTEAGNLFSLRKDHAIYVPFSRYPISLHFSTVFIAQSRVQSGTVLFVCFCLCFPEGLTRQIK